MACSAPDIAAAPKVVLAGEKWPVPVLALRQIGIILPQWMRAAQATRDFVNLTPDGFAAIVDVLHAALSRANPELTREQVLDLAIDINEIAPALTIIARQSRILKEEGGGGAPTGEAQGETISPT
jgi:hypothetical protein